MSDVLADTHTIVWSLFEPSRLSPSALKRLTAAAQGGRILISAITIVELNYLAQKKSFPYSGVIARIVPLLNDSTEALALLPVSLEVAMAMDQVPRDEVPDMPDRIIAATAVAHRLPLVSADSDIQGSASLKSLVQIIW